jgi:hypothetical protein
MVFEVCAPLILILKPSTADFGNSLETADLRHVHVVVRSGEKTTTDDHKDAGCVNGKRAREKKHSIDTRTFNMLCADPGKLSKMSLDTDEKDGGSLKWLTLAQSAQTLRMPRRPLDLHLVIFNIFC